MVSVKGQGQFWDRVTEQAQPIAEARQLVESIIPVESIKDRDVLDAGSWSLLRAWLRPHHGISQE